MTLNPFQDLGIAEPLLRALQQEGYSQPTPIQKQAIPPLKQGRDLLGIAQTGTGKTAAFALPILDRLRAENKRPAPKTARALVLAPTRELVLQIAASFRAYGRFASMRVATVIGGVSAYPQAQELARGVDVLVATPGRLIDHMSTGAVRLDATHVVVLDEADHMLDLGFILPIRRIVSKLPKERQTLLFSATMPKEIATLAGEMLRDPVEVRVTPVATTAEKVAQEAHLIETASKPALLTEILKRANVSRAIVFTRTKRGADKVARHLEARGVPASAIHGNKSQSQRQRALNDFKNGRIKTLVATDIAARGIDVDAVSHVVNFELPDVPEAYVHRIGRTARAGAEGIAISLCAPDERGLLRDIERLTRQALPLIDSRTGAKTPIDANDDTRPERRQQQRPQNGKRQRPAGNAPHHRAAGAPRNGAPNARPARKKTRRPFPQRQSAPA